MFTESCENHINFLELVSREVQKGWQRSNLIKCKCEYSKIFDVANMYRLFLSSLNTYNFIIYKYENDTNRCLFLLFSV